MLLFVLFFNVHRITLNLLVNQNVGQPILALRRNSQDLLATTLVTTYTYTQLHNFAKIKHCDAFLEFSVMSVHRSLFTEKKQQKNSLRDSNLPTQES